MQNVLINGIDNITKFLNIFKDVNIDINADLLVSDTPIGSDVDPNNFHNDTTQILWVDGLYDFWWSYSPELNNFEESLNKVDLIKDPSKYYGLFIHNM